MSTSFLVRPEAILMGFLRAFFTQDSLFANVPNEFIYTDNRQIGSLMIRLSENDRNEMVNAVPALVLQEGGFSEDVRVFDNRNWHEIMGNYQDHKGSYYHPLTIHCLSHTKASAKLLQAATARSLIMFRRGIYQLGIDHITPLNGGPPQKVSQPQHSVEELYDCTLNFTVRMEQDWWFTYKGDPEEIVYLSLVGAFDTIEFDAAGNPIDPPEEWFAQNIRVSW